MNEVERALILKAVPRPERVPNQFTWVDGRIRSLTIQDNWGVIFETHYPTKEEVLDVMAYHRTLKQKGLAVHDVVVNGNPQGVMPKEYLR